MVKIPIILLAAGASNRMGHAKQLLPWGSETLIEHQIKKLLKTGMPLIVVLGAQANTIKPIVNKFEIDIVINSNWENGMGTSVAAGTTYVCEQYADAEAALVVLLDQPLISTAYLLQMLGLFESANQQIIASKGAENYRGVPALFDRCFFNELQNLHGKEGARTIISKHQNSVIDIQCSEALDDIDTPESYHRLHKQVFGK